MIQIEINRYTINKCEQAMKKYNENKENHFATITNYVDIINKALEDYCKGKVKQNEREA